MMVTEAQVTVARESNTQRCFPVVSRQAYSKGVCMCVCVCVCVFIKMVGWHTNDLVTCLNPGTMYKGLGVCV